MNDIIKEKMGIASKVSVLHKEIIDLERHKELVKRRLGYSEGIKVITGDNSSFYSTSIDSSSDNNFHDLIIGWLQDQIDKRHKRLDELIKILK